MTVASIADGAAQARGRSWRALLEARWRDRLERVTELSLAYHDASSARPPGPTASGRSDSALRELMRRATVARRALADTDAALARLEDGEFGRCEQCRGEISPGRLVRRPEERYCAQCA
jgi:DnaK suppressor protein